MSRISVSVEVFAVDGVAVVVADSDAFSVVVVVVLADAVVDAVVDPAVVVGSVAVAVLVVSADPAMYTYPPGVRGMERTTLTAVPIGASSVNRCLVTARFESEAV
ncbi:hypothetical protein [Rhodococcus sp. 66b]|uniref:hypothetical protein n=1 Tax=Rhodococcus sp. 66b TaxID=1945511 RepID=UPI0010548E17|nr:hypothetical protein [Rhodococcus sp. 66b]